MRLNKDHTKKHIIGGFKLPYTLNEPSHKTKKWVDENNTKEVENLTGGLFVNFIRQVEKRKVLYFSPNENDENKNPDIFIHIDGKIESAQITQLVLNDYLRKFNQTKALCEKISKLIVETYRPEIKINVQIYPPWETEEPIKSSGKTHKLASKIIANSILENIEKLKSENKFLNFEFDRKIFKNFADSYNLSPVPNSHHSSYFGNDNVYIDYEFDDIKISKEDLKNSVDKIFKDKNGGNSDILLIWGDQNQFMNTETMIIQKLEERFKVSSFKSVYFLAFHNIAELQNRSILCIKLNAQNNYT
jgi:hypothetical protein